MAGGPIHPFSEYPTGSGAFPYIYQGGGANSKHERTLGIKASLDADVAWRLRFSLPPALPASGTFKLRLRALANATSGVAKVNAKWASVAPEESPSAAALDAEGTTTVTWGAGDADQYKEAKVVLDAGTPVSGEVVVMDLVFETASWTLAAISGWQPELIWE